MYESDTNTYHSATSLDLRSHIFTPKRISVSPSQTLEGAWPWPMVLDPNACEFIPNRISFQTDTNPGNNSGILNPYANVFIPSNTDNTSQIFNEIPPFQLSGNFQNIKLPNQKKHWILTPV